MKRGEVWTAAAGSGYGGKPRPAVILQDDRFDATSSVTVCLMTSERLVVPYLRLEIVPDASNGLRRPSTLMVDKIVTVPRAKLGRKIGTLSSADIERMDQSILVFLGLAG